MDEVDRRLLNVVQGEFPVTSHPFGEIGRRLGLPEREVLNRLKRLKEEGIIRRIGAVIDPRKLGWVSTLCAARVPEEKIESFATEVNRFPGVTHNYERKAYYNIWFTLTVPSWDELEERLKEIAMRTGIHEIIHLPAREIFKVRVQFDL